MDFSFNREQEILKNTVKEFAEGSIAPRALELDEKGEFPFDLLKRMGQLGLVGLINSKEYGGSGMGHLARMITVEEISRIYPPLGFFLQTGNISMYAIENYGNEEQKRKYLPDLCKGERASSFAVTEASGGSDPTAITTTANLEEGKYVINGRKTFITLSEVADYIAFLAKTGERHSLFLVEKGTPGFEVTRREKGLGLLSDPVNEFVFTNCKIPKENLIGEEGRGLGTAITAISVIGRTGAAGVALGGTEGAYEEALKFSKERVLYGKPISNLQALQFMLVDISTEIEASKWLCYNPVWLLDQGRRPRDVAVEIARAKLYSVDMGVRNCTKAIQIMGAYGFSPEYHVVRRFKDVLETLPVAGTQEIMRLTIGGSITR